MKNNTTNFTASKACIYAITHIRAGGLIMIFLFLPCCVNNANNYANAIGGICLQKPANLLFINNFAAINGIRNQINQLMNNVDETEQAEITDRSPVKTGNTNNVNTPQVNDISPIEAVEAGFYKDLHDIAEEEEIKINFPALVRIAIMLLFIVLVI